MSNLSVYELEAAKKKAIFTCWSRGELRYKCHDTQKKIYDAIKVSPHRRHYLLCSRRLGKTYLLVLLAFEEALKNPNSRILFLAPHAKDATEISSDTAVQLYVDAPKTCIPEFNAQSKEFRFKNGSIIRLKGVNGEHSQYLRGGSANLVLIDEAGLMDDLRHVLSDVVEPMTLTTKGKILIATTPPRSPGHECATIYEKYAGLGATSRFTLLDAPHIEIEEKVRALGDAGELLDDIPEILTGEKPPKTTTALREYFCEFVTDANSAVVKEFTAEAQKEIVKTWTRPDYFDAYVSIDPGMKDRTGILFGYWDFRNSKLVIEDEALLQSPSTEDIAKVLKEKEASLWNGKSPYLRVIDNDLRLISDLYQLHKIAVCPVKKEDSLGAINLLRYDVLTRTLIISPNCVNLIRQVRNCTWNKHATDFERSDIDSHYDLLAALKYMTRSVARHHNPYPNNYFSPGGLGGVPINTYVSRKRRGERFLGLFSDNPIGRKLSRKK